MKTLHPMPGKVSKPRRSSALGLLVLIQATGVLAASNHASPPPEAASWNERVVTVMQAPLYFEPCPGRTPENPAFAHRGPGGNLVLSATESAVQLKDAVVRLQLAGANPAARAAGTDAAAGRVNYFAGNDPAQWRAGVPTFARVKCAQVYPGIDLVYYGNQQQLEYDFVIAPGANPGMIRWRISGAQDVQLNAQGGLVIQTASGEITHHPPVAFQDFNGVRQPVAAQFQLGPSAAPDRAGRAWEISFTLGAYDVRRTLTVDPVLAFATYLGGAADDQAFGIAVDKEGCVYVTGQTSSTDFPVLGTLRGSNSGGYDVFVTKFKPDGSGLVYSTFLGGGQNDLGFHIMVDSNGSAVVVGQTFSINFPVSKPFQGKYGGGERDGFVTKLSPDGASLVFSSYLGGSGNDDATCVALDLAGNAYVGGNTSSTNFPVLNSLQAENRGNFDATVTKIAPDGSVVYCTYLGGSGPFDSVIGIAVDEAGDAFVTGYTSSPDFTTLQPIQARYSGGYDAFACKINPAGSGLVYSTYLGGSADDVGRSIAVDKAGNVYISGDTFSTNFPTLKPFQAANAGRRDVFVAKVNPAGSALVFSSYFGGSGEELAGLAVDAQQNICLVGLTTSSNFPEIKPLQKGFGGGIWDAFVAKLNADGSGPVFSTHLGGEANDQGAAIALDSAGSIYVAGATASGNFPVTRPFQSKSKGGTYDAFVAKISEAAMPLPPKESPVAVITPAEPKPEPKPAVKPEVKAEVKPEVKTERKADTQSPAVKPAEIKTDPPKALAAKSTEPEVIPVPPPARQTGVKPIIVAAVAKPVETPAEKQPEKPAESVPPAVTQIVASNLTFEPNLLKHALFGANLVANGDAEAGKASVSSYQPVEIPGWTAANKITVLAYGTPGGFPTTNTPGPLNRGGNFFVGGPDSPVSGVIQTVDLSAIGPVIDAKYAGYKLTAFLGGVGGQKDNAEVRVQFLDAEGKALGQAAVGPVMLAERAYKTMLILKNATGTVPTGARKAEIRLQMNRVDGAYNDAFADNIALLITPTVTLK